MTIQEAELLNRSMGEMAGTFQRNRSLGIAEHDRQEDNALQRDMLDQRQSEFAATRQDTAAHRETLAQIQRESKELQDRHYKLMEASGLLQTLQRGIADGTVKPETLKGALADNPLLKSLGLGVDLFQAPPAKKGFNTRAGHELELAENYRERANAAQRNGGGDEAERFRRIAEQLERGVGRVEPSDLAEIEEPFGAPDAFGEYPGKVRRKVPADALEQSMRSGSRGATSPTNAGGETVTVVSPSGQRGTIPKAQLQQALKEGYKLAN